MTTSAMRQAAVTEQDIQLAELYLRDGVLPAEVAKQFPDALRADVMFAAQFRVYSSNPLKFEHLRPGSKLEMQQWITGGRSTAALAPAASDRLEGYHDVLPIKAKDTVLIRKGTRVKTVQQGERLALRTYRVRVHHLLSGRNHPPGHPRHDPAYPVENPKVVLAGPGGYWSEADINDVTKVEV